MSKILYSVGTEVQVRDWRVRNQRPNMAIGTVGAGKRTVIRYNKGEDKPYVVTRPYCTDESPEHFSVDELKSYRSTNAVSKPVESTKNEQLCKKIDSLTEELGKDVAKIDVNNTKNFATVISYLDEIASAVEELREQQGKTQYIVATMKNQKVNEDA